MVCFVGVSERPNMLRTCVLSLTPTKQSSRTQNTLPRRWLSRWSLLSQKNASFRSQINTVPHWRKLYPCRSNPYTPSWDSDPPAPKTPEGLLNLKNRAPVRKSGQRRPSRNRNHTKKKLRLQAHQRKRSHQQTLQLAFPKLPYSGRGHLHPRRVRS